MLSVTKRIEYVDQPRGGYVNPKQFKATKFIDDQKIHEIASGYKAIQGMAIDYLTRFMCGSSKENSFSISLLGAANVNESVKAHKLLKSINGLDEKSIIAACQLVGYDVAYRRGPKYFSSVNKIKPDKKVIKNIAVMVKRSIQFFKIYGPIECDGVTFEGGYNGVISSGDGDFLTSDTLWDFKVSKEAPTSKHTLQLLVYYILGIHSVHDIFHQIKKIGIFNPELNTVYELNLLEVPNNTFYEISRDVIGYCMPKAIEDWKLANGTSQKVLNEIKSIFYEDLFIDTGFSPENYDDGIYDITTDDYWTYYRDKSNNSRPKFRHTHSIKFLKNSGFIMFVSVSEKGTMSLLYGGALKSLVKPLQYYYERLPEYGNLILHKFSKYWDALYDIADQIISIRLSDKEIEEQYKEWKKKYGEADLDFATWYRYKQDDFEFSGTVHGCIVDIDYFNHIYLNPYDGTLVPYSAPSMYTKYVYKNVGSLIADQRPDMLEMFQNAIEAKSGEESTALILADSKEKHSLSILEEDEIDTYNVLVTDTEMYDVSKRLKMLQSIYDYRLIAVWYDNILPQYELEEPKKSSAITGMSLEMNCGMKATVVADYGYEDITVEFADGTIIEHCKRSKFREGKIKHPNIMTEPKKQVRGNYSTYVGMTLVMNCGMRATVIEDFGYKDITIQFEDGLIRTHCRRDKFREGKIAHKE